MAIDIYCNSLAKEFNRELILDYLKKNYCLNAKGLKNFKVLCLPGHELTEIREIYDRLGLPRKNIYAVTNDQDEFEKIKKCRGIKAFKFDVLDIGGGVSSFAESIGYTKFNFIYFDFYSHFSQKLIMAITGYSAFLKNGGSFGFTFLNQREKDLTLREQSVLIYKNSGFLSKGETKILLIGQMFLKLAMANLATTRGFTKEILKDLSKGDSFGNNDPFVRHVKDYGFMPIGHFASEYVTDSGTPMATIIYKFKRAKQFNQINFGKKITDILYRHLLFDMFTIRKKDLNREKIAAEKKQIKVSKKVALDWLIQFPDKQDLDEISRITGYGKNQLRAFKAHLTMGTYQNRNGNRVAMTKKAPKN